MKLFLNLMTVFGGIVVVTVSFLAGWYLHSVWGPEKASSQPNTVIRFKNSFIVLYLHTGPRYPRGSAHGC